ncbi:MAG TPA: imidazole glycerol phosphate synthase subunit HisH [Ktedonobacterales bacterium]
MIVVVDYGAANLLSITRALEAAGASVEVSASPVRIASAQAVVLPGVGAAGAAMNTMRTSGVDMALREAISAGRPLLGICLGMQLLFERLEEDNSPGLGALAGEVRRLRDAPKVPHIGWNSLEWEPSSAPPLAREVFAAAAPGWPAYFVHSYACVPADPSVAVAWTDYGGPICAAVCRDSMLGVQFHPEKSGQTGVALLRQWVAWVASRTPREVGIRE